MDINPSHAVLRAAQVEALQGVRETVVQDKETFAGVGRSVLGHLRAIMLIDEAIASCTVPEEETTVSEEAATASLYSGEGDSMRETYFNSCVDPFEAELDGDLYRNCTGHTVTLLYDDGTVRCRLASAPGIQIRVNLIKTRINSVLSRSVVDGIQGLPDPEPGVYLIVSALIKVNAGRRDDLVVPSMVEKVLGRPVGCHGFIM